MLLKNKRKVELAHLCSAPRVLPQVSWSALVSLRYLVCKSIIPIKRWKQYFLRSAFDWKSRRRKIKIFIREKRENKTKCMGKITLTMMKMIMIRRESRRRAAEGEGWNLLSSVSFNDRSCAVLWNARKSSFPRLSLGILSRRYRHHHRRMPRENIFQLTK